MICIGLLAAFVLNDSQRRNPLKKMFLSEKVIFPGLRPSLGHIGQQAPERPVSQFQKGVSTSLQLFLFLFFSMVSEMTMLLQRKTFMIGHKIQEHYI